MAVQAHRNGGAHHPRVEVVVRNVSALFNSMDPSPFHEKDLDDDAEEFIVSWAREHALGTPFTLRIHLEQWPAEDPGPVVREAVHHYFAYRAKLIARDFHQLMRQARTSLLIGLSFLAACLFTSSYFLGDVHGTLGTIVREGLTIGGWVAMWRPMQLYLYEWWPLLRRSRLYTKLSRIPVEVVHKRG